MGLINVCSTKYPTGKAQKVLFEDKVKQIRTFYDSPAQVVCMVGVARWGLSRLMHNIFCHSFAIANMRDG